MGVGRLGLEATSVTVKGTGGMNLLEVASAPVSLGFRSDQTAVGDSIDPFTVKTSSAIQRSLSAMIGDKRN